MLSFLICLRRGGEADPQIADRRFNLVVDIIPCHLLKFYKILDGLRSKPTVKERNNHD